MTHSVPHKPDPNLDLVLERIVDVPRERVWSAWTVPEQVVKWFTPAPWRTVACTIDLRPGGAFNFTMRSPEGQNYPNTGCFLEIVENEKLVWTNILAPDFRPADPSTIDLPFTAIIALEPLGKRTRYTAIAIHRDEEGRNKHAEMGFHDGWGKALDQLVAMVKTGGG
jgi:uncharacterized protein YndB with AHSA1/START domain